MSLVYLTHHNENVTDYERVGYVETPIKKLKYRSLYKMKVTKQINQPYKTLDSDGRLLITDSGKHQRRTMGCAKTPLDPPKCFLRKNQGLKWKRLHDHKCIKGADLPPVPKTSEIPPKPMCQKRKKQSPVVEGMVPAIMHEEITPEALEIVIETTPRDQTPINLTCKVCDPCQSLPKCDPCECARNKKDTSRSPPCTSAREKNICDPCGYVRNKKYTSRSPPCQPCEYLYRNKKDTSRSPPCPSAREKNESSKSKKCDNIREEKVAEKTCRVKGGGGDGGCNGEQSKDNILSEKKEFMPKDPCKHVNFIKHNIKRMKCAHTKRPPPRYIDTPYGENHNLINSGLIPQYICGRNFGRVPCYLAEHQKMLKRYRDACATEQMTMEDCAEFIKKQGVRKMTLEERVALLAGLRANYMEQLKIFQTLSLYTDTPTKKLRKGRLEKDLDQLEMDMKFIQDNLEIYVSEY